ncbi:MAG: sulfite exporter TauE/SafE family protein [Burkholderiales bacterium]|nr:sulfite exporter TauE/SafE family protein [Burkholderiales bacterium]
MPGLEAGALLGFASILLAAGLVAGFLGGMVGAGGGLIVVPVLYYAFASLGVDPGVRTHMAVGTALAAVVPTSLLGARAHWLRGNVSPGIFRRMAIPVLLGSVLAGALAGKADGRLLSLLFALAAGVVAVNMSLRKGFALGDGLPGPVATTLIGGAIGSISTLVGIGGATLTVPVLHAFRTPMPVAVGTAATLGSLIGLPGALAFVAGGLDAPGLPPGSIGYVNLAAVAIIFPASAAAISWGARFTRRVNERLLRSVFAVFLVLTAARMVLALP